LIWTIEIDVTRGKNLNRGASNGDPNADGEASLLDDPYRAAGRGRSRRLIRIIELPQY
jgi:hypothetical protein